VARVYSLLADRVPHPAATRAKLRYLASL
jgi:hypothetical protein